MKINLLPHLVACLSLCVATSVLANQNEQTAPNSELLQQITHTDIINSLADYSSSGSGSTGTKSASTTPLPQLPTWNYNIKAYDGHNYTGSIVGRSPFLRGQTTTNVNVVVIPLKINLGTTLSFSAEAQDSGCLQGNNTATSLVLESPIFKPANIYMDNKFIGNTTYPDAHLRASFWSLIGANANSAYHLQLTTSKAPIQTINLGGWYYNFGNVGCSKNNSMTNHKGYIGVVDINSIDVQLQNIIANLKLTPAQLPVFITYGAVITNGDPSIQGNCCILGYHNALSNGQTYIIAEYDQGFAFSNTSDISTLSHEVSEWIFDPTTNNTTPAYGNIGQVSGCQNLLEVGDPLSNNLSQPIIMPNGVVYNPQELAFFSWFFTPTSYGVNNKFSSNNTFAGNAISCALGLGGGTH